MVAVFAVSLHMFAWSGCFFFLMIRRPPRSTLDRSSAASDVYKRQVLVRDGKIIARGHNKRVQEKNPILHGEMDCLNNA